MVRMDLTPLWFVFVVIVVCCMLPAGGDAGEHDSPMVTGPLSLSDCISLAMQNNPLVTKAHAQTQLARAGAVRSWSGLLPQVTASGSYSETSYADVIDGYEDIIYSTSGLSRYSTSLSIGQPLFDLTAWAEVARSHWEEWSSAEELAVVLASVALDVTEKYYSVLKSEGLVKVAEAAVRQSEENARRAQALHELGSVSRADMLVARVAHGERKLDLIQARVTADLALVDLATVIGCATPDGLEIVEDLSLVELEIPSLEGLIERALSRRQELNVARHTERAARAGRMSAIGQWLPSLSLTGSYGYRGSDFPQNDVWDEGENWSIGISASLGLFTGFSRWAAVQSATASMKIAQAERVRLELEIARQVRQAHAELKQMVETYSQTASNLEAAEESHRAARERYILGAAPILELMDAEVALTRARSVHVQARYNCMVAWAHLRRALGEPIN